ncbi:MAG: AAA family ATPase [Caulobacter sp.]|nr:AAA family ATPase [Caulobacter sp.]
MSVVPTETAHTAPRLSPYAQAHAELSGLGFTLIPITPPTADVRGAGKSPGRRNNGRWENMVGWNQFIGRKPTSFEVTAYLSWPDAGIGAIMGTPVRDGLRLVSLDIDVTNPDVLADILSACPPQKAAKVGGKGRTVFCLGGPEIQSRQYRNQNGEVLLDLLAEGRQTVLPPSLHVSGCEYKWLTGPCLIAELPVLDADALARVEETLEAAGWSRETQRADPVPREYDPDAGIDYWRETNEAALANLAAWVPSLDLYGIRPARGGYEAVASFRPSMSGTRLEKRDRNLSLVPSGIKDFATGRGHTAIDIVRLAQGGDVSPAQAAEWLRKRLGLIEESVLAPEFVSNMLERQRLKAAEAHGVQENRADVPAGPASDIPPPRSVGSQAGLIEPKPFVWRDPSTLPRRGWLYGKHFVRKFCSTTIAPGGVGKSSLTITEALAMVTGRPILGVKVKRPLRVWLFNGEDPQEEIELRIQAGMLHFGITPEEIGDRLNILSGRDVPLIVASHDGKSVKVDEDVCKQLETVMLREKIDLLVLDPLVSIHTVPENDNPSMALVLARLGRLASVTNAGVEVVHHSRKTNGNATTAEDGRGASSIQGAVRSLRVLNRMSSTEANTFNIPNDERVRLFCVTDGKANLSPMSTKADWHRIVGTPLGNAGKDEEGFDEPQEWVGVVERFEPPATLDGVTVENVRQVQMAVQQAGGARQNDQTTTELWCGEIVAQVLGLDVNDQNIRSRIKKMLTTWESSGLLLREERPGAAKNGRPVAYLVVGNWIETGVTTFA